jgi:hypothetical protein
MVGAEADAARHRDEEGTALALLLFLVFVLLGPGRRTADRRLAAAFVAVVAGLTAAAFAATFTAALARGRRAPTAAAALSTGREHRLLERVLQLRIRQLLRQLDVRLHFQRLAELLQSDLALLEADDRDDAEVDVRARADRVLVQPRARAQLQRFLQQRARRFVVLVVVGVDRLLVQVRDLVHRGLVLGRGCRRNRGDEQGN